MVVPLPPSKSPTKPYKPICCDLTVLCNQCVNRPILLNKEKTTTIGTYHTYIENNCDLTYASVYRCGCSSGIKSATVNYSTSAPRELYAQGIILTGIEIIFRYIIIGTNQQLFLHLTVTLPQTGLTKKGPSGTPWPGLTLHCDTVRTNSAVVNRHRRG